MKLPDDIEVFRIAHGDERAVIKHMLLKGANYEEIHQVIYGEDAVLKATREGDRTLVDTERYGQLNFPGGHGTRENQAARQRWLRNQPELYDPKTRRYEHPNVGAAKPGMFDRLKRWHSKRRAGQKTAAERHGIGQKIHEGVRHLISDREISHSQLMDVLSSLNWTAAEHGAGGFLDEGTPERDPSKDPTLTSTVEAVTEEAKKKKKAGERTGETAPPVSADETSVDDESGGDADVQDIIDDAVEERIAAGDSVEEAVEKVLHSLHDPNYAAEMGLEDHHFAYNMGRHGRIGGEKDADPNPDLAPPRYWNKDSRNWPKIHVGDDGGIIRFNPNQGREDEPPWMEALREETGTRGKGKRGVGAMSNPTVARMLTGHMVGQEGASSLLAPKEDNNIDFKGLYDALDSAKEYFKGDPYGLREKRGIPEGEGKGWPLGVFDSQMMGAKPLHWVKDILPAWLDDPRMLQEGYPLHRLGVTPENAGILREAMGKETARLEEIEAERKKRSSVGVRFAGKFDAPPETGEGTEVTPPGGMAEVDQGKIADIHEEVESILDTGAPPPAATGGAGMMTTSAPCMDCQQNVPLTHTVPETGGKICTACAQNRGIVQSSDTQMSLDPFNLAWGRLLKGRD